MGIVNVTPDSFSDGGQFLDADAPSRTRSALTDEGADFLDIGGESTAGVRAGRVDEERRVLPVDRATPHAPFPFPWTL